MLFCSQPFILFFLPVCLIALHLASRWRGLALPAALAASLVFYAWWNPLQAPLLIASVGANYVCAGGIRRLAHAGRDRAASRLLAGAIGADLLLLGWFKYADFAAGVAGFAGPHPVLPLAISFFTFQQIMFLVDSRRPARPDPGFVAYASFVAFFPHLIAGPIVRPAEIIPQLTCRRFGRWRADDAAAGLTLFLLGLAKKLVLADTLAGYANPGFDAAAAGASLTLAEAWVAVLAYALQIYFDFAGYSDMATGLARMLGVRFPVNFDAPYQARDIAAFWRRWHITLGAFLRDYVFVPLGGSRRGAARTGVNLFATMLLGGLWHGAAWTFVLWGALHGCFLVVHAAWRRAAPFRVPDPAAHGLTLLAVVLAWVPFRADGLAAAWAMLRALAGAGGFALPRLVLAAVPALGAVATPVPVLPYLGDARTLALPEALGCLLLGWGIALMLPPVHRLSERARGWSLTAGFALSVQALFYAPSVSPFLYFRF